MKKLINGLTRFLAFSVILFFVSCSNDDPEPSGAYANGIFIINEGNFGDGDGSVSFYSRATGETEQIVFQSVNEEESLGDVIQSAVSHNELLYLIANNSNKIEVVNTNTFESQFTITDIALPRYMTIYQGKGYLTEWVSFSDPGKVTVVNLETGAIESSIEVGSLPEDIEVVNGKIYVTEAFGSPNLYIIDMNNGNEITTLTPGDGTNQLALDSDNKLWIGCGGGNSGFPDYTPFNNGKLVKLDTETDEVVLPIELETNYAGKITANQSGSNIFYYLNNSVYSQTTVTNTISGSPLFTVDNSNGFYGIGVDPSTNNVYVSDALDFVQDGTVYVFDGNSISNFTVGRIPNGFVFN